MSERRAWRGAEKRETSQEAQQMLTSALGGLAIAARPCVLTCVCIHLRMADGSSLSAWRSERFAGCLPATGCAENGSRRCVKVCYKIIHEGKNIYIYLAVVDLYVTHLAGDGLLGSPEHLCLRGHVCDSLKYVFFPWFFPCLINILIPELLHYYYYYCYY